MKKIKRNKHIRTLTIPFMQGRPNRDKRIMKEDIINLKIALNSAKSFDAFLELI